MKVVQVQLNCVRRSLTLWEKLLSRKAFTKDQGDIGASAASLTPRERIDSDWTDDGVLPVFTQPKGQLFTNSVWGRQKNKLWVRVQIYTLSPYTNTQPVGLDPLPDQQLLWAEPNCVCQTHQKHQSNNLCIHLHKTIKVLPCYWACTMVIVWHSLIYLEICFFLRHVTL